MVLHHIVHTVGETVLHLAYSHLFKCWEDEYAHVLAHFAWRKPPIPPRIMRSSTPEIPRKLESMMRSGLLNWCRIVSAYRIIWYIVHTI